MYWKEAHAGHAIPGRHNAVLFDEDIVKPQCVTDNIFKGGRYEIFTTKLIKENGMAWWEAKLDNSRRLVKISRAEMEAMCQTLQAKLEAL